MNEHRKQRSHSYDKKHKYSYKKEQQRKKGRTEELQNLLNKIGEMSGEKVEKFMKTKFEKIVEENSNQYNHLCKAVQSRINQLMVYYSTRQQERMRKFVTTYAETTLSREQVKEIWDKDMHITQKRLPQNQWIVVKKPMSYETIGDCRMYIHMLVVTIYEPHERFPSKKQTFYHSGVKWEPLNILDFRRFKKISLEYLEENLPTFEALEKILKSKASIY